MRLVSIVHVFLGSSGAAAAVFGLLGQTSLSSAATSAQSIAGAQQRYREPPAAMFSMPTMCARATSATSTKPILVRQNFLLRPQLK